MKCETESTRALYAFERISVEWLNNCTHHLKARGQPGLAKQKQHHKSNRASEELHQHTTDQPVKQNNKPTTDEHVSPYMQRHGVRETEREHTSLYVMIL